MPIIGEEQLRRIKEATDLADLVATYSTVRRAGQDYKACCPIHQERTPSMHLYTNDQQYHCFGCGAHGDVISLVRQMENLDFVEAVEFLARRAGIQIEYQQGDGRRQGEGERLRRIMEWATQFYEQCLWRDESAVEARAYLEQRGLERSICEAFRLGWAPGRGRLLAAARQQRFDLDDLMRLDLVVQYEGRSPSDRFFERLLFPICDRFGHPIAYSGRLLPEAERRAKEAGRGVGKYINSRDTPLYHKSSVVFNLHRARKAARGAGRVIVMEGPTDVMAAAQAGMDECCAVLGTALTPEHGKQLGQMVAGDGCVLLLFDGDEAGQNNSLKAVRTCLSAGVPIRVAVLPTGRDPAELLADAEGEKLLGQVLVSARADIDHLLRQTLPRPHELDSRALLAGIDAILEPLGRLQDQELIRLSLEQLSLWTNMDQARLLRRLQGAEPLPGQQPEPVAETTLPALEPEQDQILHLLTRFPYLRGEAFDQLGVESGLFPEPWRGIVDAWIAQPELSANGLQLHERIQAEPALQAHLSRWQTPLSGVSDDQTAGAHLRDSVVKLRQQALEARRRRIEHELRAAQADGDRERLNALFKEVMAIKQQLQVLRAS